MFALRVEYLTGRSVSQEHSDRMSPEWPPHPARLYFALASAYFETGERPDERAFLEWLERLPPPALVASEAERRDVHIHFVPVNDARASGGREKRGKPATKEELSVLPEWRKRQSRTFPAALPRDPVVHFVWPQAELPGNLQDAADRLAGKVSYLGHSSSLVSVRRVHTAPSPTHEPVDSAAGPDVGRFVLRVPFAGHLEALQRSYRRYIESGVRGPLPAALQAYAPAEPPDQPPRLLVRPVFEGMVVFGRREGPVLPLLAGFRAVEALRGATLSLCPEPVPEVLSGHKADGSPSERPHVAFVALPDVGHRHADGHVMGVAAVLPTHMSTDDRYTILQALGRVEKLTMGTAGVWSVARRASGPVPVALQPETWTRPARRWATVTPILLDRYPDELFGLEAETIVATACERIGLPRPVFVLLAAHSIITGVPPAKAFRIARKEPRPMVHAVLDFPEPVPGPILLGAGRYRGWGLCRPVS